MYIAAEIVASVLPRSDLSGLKTPWRLQRPNTTQSYRSK